MKNILFIDACPRKESRTRLLAEHLLTKLEGDVRTVKLSGEAAAPLDEEAVRERERCLLSGESGSRSLAFARQFAEADEIVMAAPHWDLSFPALLKAYIENVNVIGVTFAYTEQGDPYGLCRAKKLYYVATAGGAVLDPVYGYGYVQALCERFWQIPETVSFCAERLDIVGEDPEKILTAAKEEIDRYFEGGPKGSTEEPDVRGAYRLITETLIEKGLTVTTMESCTGGLIASFLTDTEGASAALRGAFVTYSNEAKVRLGVPAETIGTYGVYSPETAAAMAETCRKISRADIGIGVTGTFGNVDPENPDGVPGQVWFAVETNDGSSCRHLEIPPQADRAAYKRFTAGRVAAFLLKLLTDGPDAS